MLLTTTRALITVACFSTTLAWAGEAGAWQDQSPLFGSVLREASMPSPGAAGLSPAAPSAAQAVVQSLYPDIGRLPASPTAPDVSASAPAAANPFQLPPAQAVPTVAQPQASNPFVSAAPTPSAARPQGSDATPFALDRHGEGEANQSKGGAVDESALRYYASQRNLERVGAEIRRLKALYPAWNPPADLFSPKSTVDEQPLWDLYTAGRLDEAKRRIAELQKTDSNYRPSADLQTKLDDGIARASIKAASDRRDWQATLAAAHARPTLLVCSEMDILWRVGEAFARTNDFAQAFDLYRYILTNCPNPAERKATMEKAAALLPQKGIDALIALGHPDASGGNEFSSMRFEKLRAAIGEVLSGKGGLQVVDPNEMTVFERFVQANRAAGDAALLGWFYYNREDYKNAQTWFQLASQSDQNPKYLEGYILAVRNSGNLADAEDLAFRNRSRSDGIAKIYVDLVADRLNDSEAAKQMAPADLDRFTAVVDQIRSAVGAQTFGWYLLDKEQPAEARKWFQKSVDWKVSEEGVVGLAVVAARTRDRSALKDIKAKYGDRFAALSDFKAYEPPARVSHRVASRSAGASRRRGSNGGDKLMQEANRQFQAGDYRGALATLDRREARSGKTYGAEILRGWTNLKLGQYDEADRVFRAQDAKRSTKDTRFGIGAVANDRYLMWPDQRNNCTIRWKC
ncbi:hypothetical protein [Jiella sp. M17.18]|uniref:hypothetical protein n=1 Tax=Jiella sp. M17.18 TaxID=3234247 RepID=UPI0034DFD0D3